MSMSDPIADMLTRIRNACLRKHAVVRMPFSKIKSNIAKVLHAEGFISSYVKSDDGSLEIELKYHGKTKESVIRKIVRISKPGLRNYVSCSDLTPVMNGQGISIITTSKGVLSDNECRDLRVSGEVLCIVY